MTAHDLRDQAADADERIADAAERATQQTVRGAQQAKDTIVSFVHEQPLISAAIALLSVPRSRPYCRRPKLKMNSWAKKLTP